MRRALRRRTPAGALPRALSPRRAKRPAPRRMRRRRRTIHDIDRRWTGPSNLLAPFEQHSAVRAQRQSDEPAAGVEVEHLRLMAVRDNDSGAAEELARQRACGGRVQAEQALRPLGRSLDSVAAAPRAGRAPRRHGRFPRAPAEGGRSPPARQRSGSRRRRDHDQRHPGRRRRSNNAAHVDPLPPSARSPPGRPRRHRRSAIIATSAPEPALRPRPGSHPCRPARGRASPPSPSHPASAAARSAQRDRRSRCRRP